VLRERVAHVPRYEVGIVAVGDTDRYDAEREDRVGLPGGDHHDPLRPCRDRGRPTEVRDRAGEDAVVLGCAHAVRDRRGAGWLVRGRHRRHRRRWAACRRGRARAPGESDECGERRRGYDGHASEHRNLRGRLA
jgi:hypothetical protein